MDLLRTFVTVVDQKGFSRAGQILSLSQPAVSLQVQRLEELLDAQLLDRKHRGMPPTSAGRELLGYARQIVMLNDQAIYHLTENRLNGHIRLGIPNEFAASYLPAVLGKFSKEHPNLTLEVVCDLSTQLLNRLQKQELDLAVAIHHDSVDPEHDPWQETLEWVSSPGYSHDSNRPVPLVVAPTGCVYRRRAIEALEGNNIPWRIVYTGTSYSGIRAAVSAGLGVTALAASSVPDDLTILEHRTPFVQLIPANVAIHYDDENLAQETRALIDYIRASL